MNEIDKLRPHLSVDARKIALQPAARYNFLGVKFSVSGLAVVLAWLRSRNASSPYAYIVTPNVDHIVRLSRAPDLGRLYDDAAFCLCDGRIVRALSRLVGHVLPLISGTDLVAVIFREVLAPGDSVCLIGGSDQTARSLREKYPELTIAQMIPPMGLASDSVARNDVVDFCQQSGSRIILLAVGSPQQEMLASEIGMRTDIAGTALCIGGATEYLVGLKRRAPLLVQRAGLEFAWRVAEDPKRLWRRYFLDGPTILPIFWRWWLRQRDSRSSPQRSNDA